MINYRDTFLMTDQPTTCPLCGARTDFYLLISPVSHKDVEIHKCLDIKCKFEFVIEIDDEFWKELKKHERRTKTMD